MPKVVIGFSTSQIANPLSWLIRTVDRVPFSHMYVRFYATSLDRVLVYHAAKHSLHFVEWERFKKTNKIIEELSFDCSPRQFVEIMQLCVDTAGIKYGMLTLIGIAIRIFGQRTGLWAQNPFKDGQKSYICSEFIYEVCKILGMEGELDAETESLRPLHKMIKSFHEETQNG